MQTLKTVLDMSPTNLRGHLTRARSLGSARATRESAQAYDRVLAAEIDVVVLGLGGPVAVDRVFDTAADGRTGVQPVARPEKVATGRWAKGCRLHRRMALARKRDAAFGIDEPAFEREEADAQGCRADPFHAALDACCDSNSNVLLRRGVAAVDVGPGDIGFDAEHDPPSLDIGTELTARNRSGDCEAAKWRG